MTTGRCPKAPRVARVGPRSPWERLLVPPDRKALCEGADKPKAGPGEATAVSPPPYISCDAAWDRRPRCAAFVSEKFILGCILRGKLNRYAQASIDTIARTT